LHVDTSALSLIWKNAPNERDLRHFRHWQRVSLALQTALRQWIPELYFSDAKRWEQREAAFPLLVYSACRLYYGRPRTEFTYEIADPRTIPLATHNIGRALQSRLQPIEKLLHASGQIRLGMRYSPVWHEDIVKAVRNKPRRLLTLLAAETRFIGAVINLGTTRDEQRFLRMSNAALRNVLGNDMRPLIPQLLEETARCVDHLIDGRILENGDLASAGSPDFRIGREEDGDHRNANRGSEVRDSRIIAKVDAGRGEPAGQRIQVGEANRVG
jgi:hypothetical protein